MQRFDKNIIIACEKSSYIDKIKIWKFLVENGIFVNFPLLDSIVLKNEKFTIIIKITVHLLGFHKDCHHIIY